MAVSDSDSDNVVVAAVEALRNMTATNAENQVTAGNADAIRKLVGLLGQPFGVGCTWLPLPPVVSLSYVVVTW